MKKIIILLLLINLSFVFAEEVQSEINHLNKTDNICKKYETIYELEQTKKNCIANRSYKDYTIDTSVTSEDEHFDDPNCIRMNNLKDSRYYVDITFDYTNYGYFNTIIKKVFLNDETEEVLNEERDGFNRIELNENRTYNDVLQDSQIPMSENKDNNTDNNIYNNVETDLAIMDIPNCAKIPQTCIDNYYDVLYDDQGYAGFTRWVNPYTHSNKRIHIYAGITAKECRKRKEYFNGKIIGREQYENGENGREYPDDKDQLEFRMNSNTKLDRFNNDYIDELPLEQFEHLDIDRSKVFNEFSFNNGQSYKHTGYMYASRQCKPNTGTLNNSLDKCLYKATIRCDANSRGIYSSSDDICKISDTPDNSILSKTCVGSDSLDRSSNTCSLPAEYVEDTMDAPCDNAVPAVTCPACTPSQDTTCPDCTPSPAIPDTMNCPANNAHYECPTRGTLDGTLCKYGATVTCKNSEGVSSSYNSSTNTCDYQETKKCYGSTFTKPSSGISKTSYIIDANGGSLSGAGTPESGTSIQLINGTYYCSHTPYCPTKDYDEDQNNHIGFDNSDEENNLKIDYPHTVTTNVPPQYGPVGCARKYYWYTYHCPVDNNVTFNLGDPEFHGIGPDFDTSGTDSLGYPYYSRNPDKRSGAETGIGASAIGNPIRSSGTVDCHGSCKEDQCICKEDEFPAEPPINNCKVWNESTDKDKYCVIEDDDNMCNDELETSSTDLNEYKARYDAWNALPDRDPNDPNQYNPEKYMLDKNGNIVLDEFGNQETLDPDKEFIFTSKDKTMSLAECDELSRCLGSTPHDHNGNEVCEFIVGGTNEDNVEESQQKIVEPIDLDIAPITAPTEKSMSSNFNGLEDIFSVEQVMDGEWGYYSNYLNPMPKENTIKVANLQISPIEGSELVTISDPINYSYAHQNRSTTTKKPNFLAGALGGTATGIAIYFAFSGAFAISAIVAAVIIVFVLFSALFGKDYKLRETHINWELWKNKTDTYVLNPYGYDGRGIFGAQSDAYNPVSVNDTTPVSINKGSDSALLPYYQTQRARWLRFTNISDGNGLILNRNNKDYLSYGDMHYFTGTQESEEGLVALLDNVYKIKETTFTALGFAPTQIDRTNFESKTIAGFPKCKWYNLNCTKRNYAQTSGMIVKNKDENTIYLGATNSVSIVVPFAGEYIVKAFDKNDNELSVVSIEDDFWQKSSGSAKFARVMFGLNMELSSGIPENNACRKNTMVEWGGGVSGIYNEERDEFSRQELLGQGFCEKSDDNYVRDHAATYLTLTQVGMLKEFKVPLEKPLPFPNRVALVTLNEKEIRKYRCFEPFGDCGIEGENNKPPQEYIDNPENFTPDNFNDTYHGAR